MAGWPNRRITRRLAALLTALPWVVAGCGVGDYEALMDKREKELMKGAPFVALAGATKCGDTGFRIRMPSNFGTNDREHPLLFKLPNLVVAFQKEGPVPDKAMCSCYLAATPPDPRGAAKLLAAIKPYAKAAPAWEPEQVATPEGGTLEWQKLRVEGDLPFDCERLGDRTKVNLPGIVEIWFYGSPTGNVIMLWQIPAEIEEKEGLLKMAPVAAGSLEQIAAPPAADQPAAAAPP